MLKNHDIQLIAHLRKNSRKKITEIAKQENKPATTLYDRLKVHQKNCIKKHTTLLDFQKLGFNSKMHIAIKVDRDTREQLQEFLIQHPNVNSLYKVGMNSDFLAECIFKNIAKQQGFIEELQRFDPELTIYEEVQEIKKEDFLTKPEHFGGYDQ